ncbi:thiamine phosphate synthase [Mangrovibacterium lignilyticum]|uniref:thiamine phosphate synthase n=1 Tax=Mangrovibacterium lignilyticum TaxID=2668052 RepID=UPI0013D2C1C8|nr:thiamine phosphate synthase [Mangrovibacterium lignilyticum]
MQLTIISYPDHFKREAEGINQLFELGMNHFHLRKPEWKPAEIANLLNAINPVHYPKIVIHDHFQLALDYGLGGIHFSGRTMAFMDQWTAFTGSQSTSCHSLRELQQLPDQIDYAFLSPIFPSISKPGYQAEFELDDVKQFLATYHKSRVIALGGIAEDKVSICRTSGFDGIAVLGTLWQTRRSQERILDHFQNLKKSSYRLYKETLTD